MFSESLDTLTIRLLMIGSEVNCLIGRKAEVLHLLRSQSNSRIAITDGCSNERIVTITASPESSLRAFTLIAQRYDDHHASSNKKAITVRLLVPACLCGVLIGKGGSNIRHIRDQTGASVQIASDLLIDSTERIVTVTGVLKSITDGVHEIFNILRENPIKEPIVYYVPNKTVSDVPVIISNGNAYVLNGKTAVLERNQPLLYDKNYW